MGVPGWLLQIVVGFLTGRVLVVNYKGQKSENKNMPGGGPQGTVLGMFLFLVLINDAGFPEEDRYIGEKLTRAVNAKTEIRNTHLKYVDDLTIAEAMKLKNVLTVDSTEVWERPVNYHNRTEQKLNPENSQVQAQLSELAVYANTNEMKINQNKSKVMLFNTSYKNDFTPEIEINGVVLEVVEQMKLLGVMITSDLKWRANTEFITKKAYKRLWLIKRLKQMGASLASLLDIYVKHVRSVVEFAAVVWSSSLTKEDIGSIERVQKCAFAIILGAKYRDYEEACANLSMEKLTCRREKLALNFAKKSSVHPIHNHWFVPNTEETITRSILTKFKPVLGRTQRLLHSAIPYLTQLLNEDFKKTSQVPL